jgi:tRNA(fMet)-specific endonuclease VapC
MIYALDTNIISYCLKGLFELDQKIDQSLVAGDQFVIPPVTFYESLRGLLAVGATTKLKAFMFMCQRLEQSELEHADWVQAAKLYAGLKPKGQLIADADLLQAAFCMQRNYALVTHNVKHFSCFEGLMVCDWAEQKSK